MSNLILTLYEHVHFCAAVFLAKSEGTPAEKVPLATLKLQFY